MREAIYLAVGYVFSDVPWYLLACVPFMDRQRIPRWGIYLLAAFMTLFRAACGFILVLGISDWWTYTGVAYLVTYVLLAALFLIAFRVSPIRLLYVYLLVYSISTCINQAAGGILKLLFPQESIALSSSLLLAVFQFSMFLLFLPLLYRLFKGSLKQAVEGLDTRSIMLLCITPLIFAVLALVFSAYADRQTGYSLWLSTLHLLISVAGVTSYIINLKMLLDNARHIRLESEAENRLALQAQNYENLTESIEAARAARHDLRHHINALFNLAEQDDKEELIRYLEEYTADLPVDDALNWCENHTVNALLKYYLSQASRAGVELDVKLNIPAHPGVPDTDLCVVFGNIFENAASSAAAAGDGAYLRARCETFESDIVVTVQNSIGSAGPHGEGLGLRNVETVTKKRGGTALFEAKNGVFFSRVILKKVPSEENAADARPLS